MIRKTVVALSIAAFAAAGTASAQENATFTMRSGERQAGQLMDLGGVRFHRQDQRPGAADSRPTISP